MAGSSISRIDNWHVPLKQEIFFSMGNEFKWGENDCFQFVSRCILAQTNVDPRKRVTKYKTERGAARAIKNFGGDSLEESFASLMESLGLKEIPVGLGKRGYVVMYDDPVHGKALGIVDMDNRYALFVGREQDGLVRVNIKKCFRCWGFE